MNGVEYLAATARAFGPGTGELRGALHAGLRRAQAMLESARTPEDADSLTRQLIGLQRISGRLRERLAEASND